MARKIPKKFILEIELGNDAMQTQGDIRDALASVSRRLDYHGTTDTPMSPGTGDPIKDRYGNTVGKWKVK